jgi:hypothetical protein
VWGDFAILRALLFLLSFPVCCALNRQRRPYVRN